MLLCSNENFLLLQYLSLSRKSDGCCARECGLGSKLQGLQIRIECSCRIEEKLLRPQLVVFPVSGLGWSRD